MGTPYDKMSDIYYEVQRAILGKVMSQPDLGGYWGAAVAIAKLRRQKLGSRDTFLHHKYRKRQRRAGNRKIRYRLGNDFGRTHPFTYYAREDERLGG
jgi:hypothetical protein